MKAKLYLFPCNIAEVEVHHYLPSENLRLLLQIKFFIVENVRTARRFLKLCHPQINIDALTFFELNEHTPPNDIPTFIIPLLEGNSMGLLSEAGCPAVADPGAQMVALAHKHHCEIVPLIGPSSILLALMASGFNGQSFTFNGYLPLPHAERIQTIRKLESKVYHENQTQIFIETPYRNNRLLADLILVCKPDTQLCIATNLNSNTECIKTQRMVDWKKNPPDINKKPTVFLLYK